MIYGYNAPGPVLFINKMLKFGHEAANQPAGCPASTGIRRLTSYIGPTDLVVWVHRLHYRLSPLH